MSEIEDLNYCTRGCIRKRHHLTDCADEECRGCEPRRADHGLLCWPCHRRLALMLDQAEITERWLNGNLPAGMQAARGREDYEQVRSHKEPPTPLNLAILDVRMLLGDQLACWADNLTADRQLTGPKQHSIVTDAHFLLTWLTTMEHQDWIGDMFEELAETLSDAHTLAPWRPEVRRVNGIPCPECHQTALLIYGGEEDVTCGECRQIMTPARYGIWAEMFKAERAAEVEATA